jgi:uncharacterized protein YifN (PemK superfamily)
MVKIRPVVVLSRRDRRTSQSTVLVVPLSTAQPTRIEPYHVRIPAETYSFLRWKGDQWIKADMIAAVSPTRLSPLSRHGRSYRITSEDFRAIQRAVLHALGLERLTGML